MNTERGEGQMCNAKGGWPSIILGPRGKAAKKKSDIVRGKGGGREGLWEKREVL